MTAGKTNGASQTTPLRDDKQQGAKTDLADAGVADEEELEEVVVFAGVHGDET